MSIKQIKFTIFRIIVKILTWFMKRSLDLKFLYLDHVKYRGKKVPVSEYIPSFSPEFINSMRTTTAANEVTVKLGLAPLSTQTCGLISMYLNNMIEKAEVAKAVEKLFTSTTKRRDVFNMMVKVGDITERQLAFKFPGEKRQALEDWLDNKENN